MTGSGAVGSVTALWRFPVKSMTGEQLEQAELTRQGFVGDRAYALIDANTGKLVSAKSVRLFPDLCLSGDIRRAAPGRPQNCPQCGSRCRTAPW